MKATVLPSIMPANSSSAPVTRNTGRCKADGRHAVGRAMSFSPSGSRAGSGD
jgi:hypothetical protein